MKRSEINRAIEEARAVLARIGFRLPDFSTWSLDKWRTMRSPAAEIFRTGMGWDVTDFGSNDFAKMGATIFTLRNGLPHDRGIGVPYAEKIIILTEGQTIPLHFHFKKTEDIINRGNGILCIKLYKSNQDKSVDVKTKPGIKCDGVWSVFEPGQTFEVLPGNSVTMTPGLYHAFWAKKDAGTLVCGEVSSINDDNIDNHFSPSLPRFAHIDEDEPIRYILCNEYEKVLG
jgi:D-lyxose ketol-isomerase